MIAKDQLKHNWLYKVKTHRNDGCAAVWDGPKERFILPRYEWGNYYPMEQFHYEDDPRFGTVEPLVEIEECRGDIVEVCLDFNAKVYTEQAAILLRRAGELLKCTGAILEHRKRGTAAKAIIEGAAQAEKQAAEIFAARKNL